MFKIIENNIYLIFYSLLANDIIFNIAMPPSENTKRTLTIAFKGKNLHLASNQCFVPCKKEASTFWKSFKKVLATFLKGFACSLSQRLGKKLAFLQRRWEDFPQNNT